jgi:hypothetical protein
MRPDVPGTRFTPRQPAPPGLEPTLAVHAGVPGQARAFDDQAPGPGVRDLTEVQARLGMAASPLSLDAAEVQQTFERLEAKLDKILSLIETP